MLRTRPRGPLAGNARPHSLPGHQRLAGADRSAIDRLPGAGALGGLGNARPGSSGLGRHHGPGSRQLGDQIGTRRYHRPRRGLSRQGTPSRDGVARPACGAGAGGRWRGVPAAASPRADADVRRTRRARCSRARPFRRRRERLTRAGQNLAGPGRRRQAAWQTERPGGRARLPPQAALAAFAAGAPSGAAGARLAERGAAGLGRNADHGRLNGTSSRQRRPQRSRRPVLLGGSLGRRRFCGRRRRRRAFQAGATRASAGSAAGCPPSLSMASASQPPQSRRPRAPPPRWSSGDFESVEPAQLYRHVFVDGAGVRLLLGYAQFGEPVQYLVGLDFQLPRQLVDTNLLHRQSNPLLAAETPLFAATFLRGARSFRMVVSGGTRVFHRSKLLRGFLLRFGRFRPGSRGFSGTSGSAGASAVATAPSASRSTPGSSSRAPVSASPPCAASSPEAAGSASCAGSAFSVSNWL